MEIVPLWNPKMENFSLGMGEMFPGGKFKGGDKFFLSIKIVHETEKFRKKYLKDQPEKLVKHDASATITLLVLDYSL
jgi:hypothetical protein